MEPGWFVVPAKANKKAKPTVKAVRLYQDLLRFHQDDADPAARLDADLLRLNRLTESSTIYPGQQIRLPPISR